MVGLMRRTVPASAFQKWARSYETARSVWRQA